MENSKNWIHEYLRAVRRELSCSPRQKTSLLKRLQTDLEDFAEEFDGELQFSDLETHFGSPAAIAAELNANTTGRTHNILRKLLPVWISIPVLLTAILLISIHIMRSMPEIPEISIHSFSDYGYIYTGEKTAVYRNASGEPLLTVTVDSVFRNNRTTVKPESAEISVVRHDPDVVVNKQYTYFSGNVVYGCTNVTYNGKTTTQFVRVYCDKRGNFS